MKTSKTKVKFKALNRDEMLKIRGGTGAEPIVVIIDGKVVYIWP
jgi:hypothetical protein